MISKINGGLPKIPWKGFQCDCIKISINYNLHYIINITQTTWNLPSVLLYGTSSFHPENNCTSLYFANITLFISPWQRPWNETSVCLNSNISLCACSFSVPPGASISLDAFTACLTWSPPSSWRYFLPTSSHPFQHTNECIVTLTVDMTSALLHFLMVVQSQRCHFFLLKGMICLIFLPCLLS